LEYTAHNESTLTGIAVNRWLRTRGVQLVLGAAFFLLGFLVRVCTL
jgi:hypothetical protein